MAGIENITKVIARDAESEAASIIASAKANADVVTKKAQDETDKMKAEADERLEKLLKNLDWDEIEKILMEK